MPMRPVPGLFRRWMTVGGDQGRQSMVSQLRRGSVFFSYVDRAAERARVAGSGVIADVQGTKVVFTAAHVFAQFAREFEAGEMALSVNMANGHFIVRPEFPRLATAGAEHGADAGVLVLPDSPAASYFNFGGFDPPRARTISVSEPPAGIDCAVAGWPASHAVPTRRVTPGEIQLGLDGGFQFIGTGVESVDDTFVWLSLTGPLRNELGDEAKEIVPGDLAGMSGCGCWLLEGDLEPMQDPDLLKDIDAARANPPWGLSLYGIHTATAVGRLRETRLTNHLRLLASMNGDMREKVSALWPALEI